MSQVVSRGQIRTRLLTGFGVMMVLLLAAGAVGWTALRSLSASIRTANQGVEEEARLSTALATDVAREIAVAARYIEDTDPAAAVAFDSLRWHTHATHRALRRRELRAEDKGTLVGIDQALSDAEVRYVVARRLREMGRAAEAAAQTDSARAVEAAMLGDLDRLGDAKAKRLGETAGALEGAAQRRAWLLVALIAVAAVVATVVVLRVVRSISGPLDRLARHAGALGEGDLTARTTGHLPGELGLLAEAMNRTSDSLSRIGAGAAGAADSITRSADDLSAISEQLAAAVGEVTRSMTQVSGGAADQVKQLRRVDDALRAMLDQARKVATEVREVSGLAASIEEVARSRREETAGALLTLIQIKRSVQEAAAETEALHAAVADINSFVETVDEIAAQTNLLGLNAAIEAARAGEEGAGFAVVAGEVRKLAGQARAGAERVAGITRTVRQRVESTARAMTAGAAQVDEIERVAQQVEAALATILVAAERTRAAAESVTSAAEGNAAAAVDAASGIAAVAETAEVHAETAEGVRAATTQQESACILVADATRRLIGSAAELRGLVGNLTVAPAEAPKEDQEDPGDAEPTAAPKPFIDTSVIDPNLLTHADGISAHERLRRRRVMAMRD
ncbi:methyl-accepting chemotaxis protein [Longimicrobium sp.]|uniref:methyl-accepting chemotaxis protein n=1 Tax=Longimicrobium sp. TaxID=2029185 RepID=UPI002B662C0C|nr:methyl-accepting chemotaxis protein [Longimicrobium sp.]HSU17242.1 methyl-accepting chemotaxis protein [Longimicrobium sp.]